MAIDFKSHKAVVIITPDEFHFGFPHLYSAVGFIERQVPKDKAFNVIAEALSSGGVNIEGKNYQIMDIIGYDEAYGDDASEDDE